MGPEMTAEDWQKRYDAAQESMREMAQQIDELQQRVLVLQREKIQWDQDKVSQQTTIAQEITRLNAERQDDATTIAELRSCLKAMGMEIN